MKILIVEDEPSLRELIQCSLEKERYVVETASDFNSALRKIEDYDYDCILLDIMLPDGSGLDLLERLKALHKQGERDYYFRERLSGRQSFGIRTGSGRLFAKAISFG